MGDNNRYILFPPTLVDNPKDQRTSQETPLLEIIIILDILILRLIVNNWAWNHPHSPNKTIIIFLLFHLVE